MTTRGGDYGLQAVGEPNDRQGEYCRTDVYVWRCGDDVCDCAEVLAERLYWNRLTSHPAYWRVPLWRGEFVTDYSRDADARAVVRRDLVAALDDVRKTYPDEKWGHVTIPVLEGSQ